MRLGTAVSMLALVVAGMVACSGAGPIGAIPDSRDGGASNGELTTSVPVDASSDATPPTHHQPESECGDCGEGRVCSAGKCVAVGCKTSAECPQAAHASVACQAGTCVLACDDKFHACGGHCRSETDPNFCGATCAACPPKANAVAVCTNGGCQTVCNQGFHDCGGTCVKNDAVATCGTSCSACASPSNGTATCDGSSCGVDCDQGYYRDGSSCTLDCTLTGCGPFEWCDANGTHLCKPGCETHDECTTSQFCKLSTHTCTATTSPAVHCPTGYVSRGVCSSDGGDECVNASLPSGTTYAATCPTGTTSRGTVSCTSTHVCVPD